MNATDLNLLSRYTRQHVEDAFAEIVRRHLDLVYSAAFRQVRSPQLAEEVAQSAFTDLARNACRLAPDTILTAWLYQVTRRTAIDVVRREARRRMREQIASEMNATNATAADWSHIEPLLDEAMDALEATDRTAVLLRYFENKPLREIGQQLGVSDDAAQKRVSRAVERLREFFAKRGVTVGAGGLGVLIAANAVQSAPAGLAITISTAAALTGASLATTATATTTKAIAMTTLQKTLVGTALLAAVGTGIYEARQASTLRQQVRTLQQQQAPLVVQIEQLQCERDEATNRLAVLMAEVTRMKSDNLELLRLRGEVTRLRNELLGHSELKASTAGGTAESEETSWLERVKLLKERYAQTTEAQFPEFHYLTDEDWLRAAKPKLDTEESYQAAFDNLRSYGEGGFMQAAEKALRKYLEDNNGQFPTELVQLKSYFESPAADALLGRYEIVPAKSVPQANMAGSAGDWLITAKAPHTEAQWYLGRNGLSGVANTEEMAVLAPAIKALFEATPIINGKKGIDLHQLGPYLTTPEQKAAYQKLVEGSPSGTR